MARTELHRRVRDLFKGGKGAQPALVLSDELDALSPEDRRRSAYREGGRALVGMLTPGADPVSSVSIIPSGQGPGVTFAARDRNGCDDDRDEFEATMKVALGGRAAEELVFSQPSPGTQSHMSDEVRHIVEKHHTDVLALLSRNRWRLDALASALLRYETLDQSMAYAAAGLPEPGSAPGSFAAAALRATPPAA